MDAAVDVHALMQEMGARAREAAASLAYAPAAQKDAALTAAADAIWEGRVDLLAANAADMADARAKGLSGAMLDRLARRSPGPGPGDGRRTARDRGAGRSGRRGNGRVGPPVRAAHPPGADAHRRRRGDLREPAERDRRRGRALPQGRERGDPARRVGEPSLGAGDPCRTRGRAPDGRPAGGRGPAGAGDRPGRGRRDADDDPLHRRPGATRRQGAGPAGAGQARVRVSRTSRGSCTSTSTRPPTSRRRGR